MQPTDKFVGFVDIMGFKSLVRTAEAGKGLSLEDLSKAVEALGTEADLQCIKTYGPKICPMAPRVPKDLDFQITRSSDCVIVSAEVSPAGVINLISHCWTAQLELLGMGILCRGYIKRGLIYHTKLHQIGSGLSNAVEREKQVSVFKQNADEQGTPFIEVSPEIVEYVATQGDKCVKEMFSRHVQQDGLLTALFPFKRLNHSFAIPAGHQFDPEKEKKSVDVVRGWIRKMKDAVSKRVDQSDPKAVNKGSHYLRMLDKQLAECDWTEEVIDRLARPLFRS
ncbi:MAG: hypothetical protein WCE23_03285 [Candidatus Binatus sp.]|uniref:hypothetical protein n=1 Tax=Candidatus Binatus sp. TaxID=2811406 RepID=UPI003C794CFB